MGAVGPKPLRWAGQFDPGTIFDVCPGGGEGQLRGAIRKKKRKKEHEVSLWRRVAFGEGHTTYFARRVHRFALSIAAGE